MLTKLMLGAAFAAVYLVWGSTYLAIAVAVETIPPLLMMGLRSAIAGAALYFAARAAGAAVPTRSEWLQAARVGALFFAIGHGLLSWGETRVASGAAALLIATEPLFIVLLGWSGGRLVGRPRGERPRGIVLAAVAIGMVGVAVLSLPGSTDGIDPVGAGALLVASFAWSIGTFYVPRDGSPVRAAGMQLLTGGALLLLLALIAGELRGWSADQATRESLLALGFLIVFGSVLTFSAYVWLLQRIGAARVASHTYVNPLVAVALGAWLGGEAVSGRMLFSGALVLAAVVMLVQSRRPADESYTRGESPRRDASRMRLQAARWRRAPVWSPRFSRMRARL